MNKASRDFRAAGLGVGVNIHVTLGMNMSPPRKTPLPCHHKVDFDGAVFAETYCPLDEGLQQYLADMYATLARVEGIDNIWIDDDFRYKTKAGQCFCPLHLGELAKDTGRDWTRPELVEALPSTSLVPSDLAVTWGRVQDRGLVACARAIADAVHRAAPNVRIGFMPPSGDVSFYGAECVSEIGRVLNPSKRGLARPEYGAYNDLDRVAWSAYRPTWAMKRAFGDSYEGWPELETWPGTGYNHSARVAQMKLAWGAIHGYVSTTISTARVDKPMLKAIANAKKQIAQITPFVTSSDWQARGVSLELSENTLGLRTTVDVLTDEKFAARLVGRTGLPLWPEGGCGRILVGNSPLARREDLAQFAREGMILDRDAFAVLEAMGRDDIAGGARLAPRTGYAAAERFTESELNGKAAGLEVSLAGFSPVRESLPMFQLPDSPEFTVLSRFQDQGRQPMGVSLWARQWADGKIVVLPFSLGEPGTEQGFLTAVRKSQVEALLAWLTGSELPARLGFAEAYDVQIVYRQHCAGDRLFLGLANFGLDDATEFSIYLPLLDGASAAEVRVLDSKGKWRSLERPVGAGGRLEVRGPMAVPDQEVRAFEIIKKA